MKKLILALLVTQLFGCAAMNKAIQENAARRQKEIEAYQASMPMCSSQSECDEMMGNAQAWVSQHSNLQLATATNSIINTFRDPQGFNSWYSVTKTPIGGGRYRIVMETDDYNAVRYGIDFNRFVGNK
jgi:hypothetical protein